MNPYEDLQTEVALLISLTVFAHIISIVLYYPLCSEEKHSSILFLLKYFLFPSFYCLRIMTYNGEVVSIRLSAQFMSETTHCI
jgi:uncharacterized protein YhhL (DUF1145 family)